MRRKTSDRNKSKSTPEKSPEKSSRKSHRHSRRRRKSSSSSSEDEKPLKKSSGDIRVSEPKVVDQKRESNKETAEAVVKPDIESDLSAGSSKKSIKKTVLPNETTEIKSVLVPEETPSKEEKPPEWKEDSEFWNASTEVKVETTDATTKEKDGGSLWKVQSANGAGGEIQKLKICRQRPPETSESGDSGKRRSSRPSDGGTSSRSTDESVHEDGDKDMKKSKHLTRTSSRNSPSLSESSKVVCDVSEESPTKIKIINVSNLSLDKKSVDDSESIKEISPAIGVNENCKIEQVENTHQINHEVLSADIPLPNDDQVKISNEVESDQKQENNAIPSLDEIQTPPEKDNNPTIEQTIKPLVENSAETNDKSSMSMDLSEIPEPPNEPKKHKIPHVEDKVEVKEDGDEASQQKSTKINTRKKQDSDSGSRYSRSSSRSSSNSDSEASKEHRSQRQRTRVKLKRRITKQSPETQQHTSGSPKKESSDSEVEIKKEEKEEDKLRQTENNINRENGPNVSTEIGEEGNGTTEQTKVPRKRRWGASKSIRPTKKPLVSISTHSLKDLVPGAKPVSAEELQLSVEEEEGQLDDDDDDDDEVTILAIEEKVVEQEREKEEKKRESRRERDKEKVEEERRKRSEKREKIKPEQPSVNEKGGSQRKILLLTDDARKLARSPSPPRRRPSSVLYITNLVRPFTVQQLRNLLLRTGTIAENGFWMDSIKSKCYVEYTTEDAAVETRHALHGVRWPVSNPKTLIVEFSTHDDMSVAQALAEETEPIPRKAEPLILDRSVEGWLSEQARLKGERPARRVMAAVREWDVGKPEHPDEIIEQDLRLKERQREQERRVRKERSHRSATPDTAEPPVRKPRRKEEDAPAKLLDDLFRKTKTSPCIYWLPLTQEQIVVKEEMRRQHMAEHERRVAEIKKADQARRDKERRTRK